MSIVVEHRIRDIVADMPEVRLNDDFSRIPYFGWGDKLELLAHMKLKQDDIYPLIWLLLDEEHHSENGSQVQRRCDFIIATREIQLDLLNPQRYVKCFDVVLNPVTQLMIEGLRSSSVTGIVDDKWTIFKRPNYSEIEEEFRDKTDTELPAIDLWDAVRLSCEVLFNDNCLNPIKWQTIKKTP